METLISLTTLFVIIGISIFIDLKVKKEKENSKELFKEQQKLLEVASFIDKLLTLADLMITKNPDIGSKFLKRFDKEITIENLINKDLKVENFLTKEELDLIA